MENKKETAVERMYNLISYELIDYIEKRIDIHEFQEMMLLAKNHSMALEQEQMNEAWENGFSAHPEDDSFEQFYNQTYGK